MGPLSYCSPCVSGCRGIIWSKYVPPAAPNSVHYCSHFRVARLDRHTSRRYAVADRSARDRSKYGWMRKKRRQPKDYLRTPSCNVSSTSVVTRGEKPVNATAISRSRQSAKAFV
jgi:hypothetical protein